MPLNITSDKAWLTTLKEYDLFWRNLSIAGIEVTQAVQYYNAEDHLTDSADRGGDNSVRLVAGKPAWVRVYVNSMFGVSGVTGTLEVQRRSNGFLWSTVSTQNAALAQVPALTLTSYAAMRGSLQSTLNFVIPANEMIGTLRLNVRATAGSRTAEASTEIAVTLRQTLRLAGIMIAYNGPASSAPNAPNLTIAAPTLANLQAMAGTALTLFPVQSTANFRTAGTITLQTHLQDTSFPASGCGVAWDALHAAVVNARTADGNQAGWVYYGLLPAGVPMGPVGGCGGGGVAVGPIGQPGTLAHEAGHACGLGHAPAGGAPNPDPAYPAYEPYDPANTPQASTGEYGLNVNNGLIASPQTFRDFMSYAGPSWISLYHYRRLLDNALLNPVTVGIDDWWWKNKIWEERLKWPPIPEPDPPFDLDLPMFPPPLERREVISLIVRIERNKVAEVMHVARVRTRAAIEGAERTSLTARLVDDGDALLAEAPLLRLDTAASGCCRCSSGGAGHDPTSYLAQVFIPDVGQGVRLEISDAEAVLWHRKAPNKPTQVDAFDAKVDRHNRLHARWKTSGKPVEFWLLWSTDGQDWRSLSTGLSGKEVEIDVSQLPPGKVELQLVAHDGFFSGRSRPVKVEIAPRAPDAAILHPVDRDTYVAGETLRLWAVARNADGSDVEPDRCVWTLGKKEVGRGLDLWITPEAGEHELRLKVKGEGGVAESRAIIIVSGRHNHEAAR